jgi:gamma-glutamyltranspeptidase / glutathione hydrolase
MRYSTQFERTAAYGMNAAIATSHPLASQVGLQLLREGGNAVDAAIAAVAVLGVVEPGMTGIGGDCFVLYAPAGTGRVIALNGSGTAPAAASLDYFKARGITTIGAESPNAVTIPGAVDSWCRLAGDHGTRGIDALLAPAIALAEDGHPVHQRVALDWEAETPRLRASEAAAAVFLPGGRTPRAGDVFRQPQLAATLRAIARQGRAAFYEGPIAAEMTAVLRRQGGLHTLEDFAGFRAEYVEPIEMVYQDHRILECPPNGQGVAALMLLNVLARCGLGDPGLSEADRIHLLAEATKQVYRQRDRLVADPRKVAVPVADMLSAAEADRLRAPIRRDRAARAAFSTEPDHVNTVYLCAVDRDGNAISFINSIFDAWGSTIVAPRAGVLFHNRGQSFRLEAEHPNAIAGGKRPFHTIIPGMAMKDGRAVAPFGVMGGQYQAVGHAAVLSNVLERGMDVQQAIGHPRSFAFDGKLRLEPLIDGSVAADLERRGHVIDRSARPIGGGQAIWIDHARGVLIAGTDPRKDGCSLAY